MARKVHGTTTTSLSMTQGEIFQYVALLVTALMGAVFGAHAGWVNTKRSYVRTAWILLCLPLITYICASPVAIFLPDHQPTSFTAGPILFWHLIALPLVGAAAAFAWALVWLACYLYRIVRDRNG